MKKKPAVAVIRLEGPIMTRGMLRGGIHLEAIKDDVDKAFKIKPKAVVFQVNCPGGSPVQSEMIYHYVRAKAEKTNISVYTFAEDVAASGGYWLMTMGDHSYASPASIIGSIGVISSGFGYVGALKKLGVERRVYAQGEHKNILDPFLPEDKKSIEILKDMQKDVYESFKAHVKKSRNGHINADDETLFSGAFWTGKKAQELGLVDEVGEMYAVLNSKFGEELRYVKVQPNQSWIKRKLSSSIDSMFAAVVDRLEVKAYWSLFRSG